MQKTEPSFPLVDAALDPGGRGRCPSGRPAARDSHPRWVALAVAATLAAGCTVERSTPNGGNLGSVAQGPGNGQNEGAGAAGALAGNDATNAHNSDGAGAVASNGAGATGSNASGAVANGAGAVANNGAGAAANNGAGTEPAAGAAATDPAAAVVCANADTSSIPIDATGWVAAQCNDYGIQGAFYCFDDMINASGCSAGEPPWTASGMCLNGVTTVDTTFAAWGAGIGFSLNDSGEGADGMASVKRAFDATAVGIIGFSITLSGDTDGLPVRIGFTGTADAADSVAPHVEVPGVAGTPQTYEILIDDALVPEEWDACEGAACFADPASLFDIQVQIVGGNAASNYSFCVDAITPITDGSVPSTMGGNLTAYGGDVCANFDTISVGPFMVQNNAYNGANHCIQALWDNGDVAGFNLSGVSANAPAGGAPASYPSLVYGWHVDGQYHGGYQSARAISSIGSMPSDLTVTVPGAGRYNASYDNWLGADPNAPNESGTLEHMIWLNYRDTTPIGSQVDTVELAGTQWVVWYGPNLSWNTVSYVRATNTSSVSNLDLMEFINDSVSRGYVGGSDYVLGVQAGFEIWESSQNFSVDRFKVSVN
jgi:hypothetical protein